MNCGYCLGWFLKRTNDTIIRPAMATNIDAERPKKTSIDINTANVAMTRTMRLTALLIGAL